MSQLWLSEEQQRVWRAYLSARATIDTFLESRLRPFGLNLPEYEVLVELSEAPGHQLRMRDLAHQANQSRSRLTHTVNRLEKRGLVERTSCASDGRGVMACLQDAGYELLVRAAPDHVSAVREVLVDRISPSDFQALGRVASAVVGAHLKD